MALTELVANAWDAGAAVVDITIPDERGEELIISDDGTGLTPNQFHNRWMKLGYSRLRNQGPKVDFPPGREGKRLAYGRNGVGRHGLLCFNDEYTVYTRCEGEASTFLVSTQSEDQPFVLKDEKVTKGKGNGTTLTVVVARHLPDPDRILEVISARFLHDPSFQIKINGRTVPLEDHQGLIDSSEVEFDGIKLKFLFVDSQKAARSTLYQGIAFWQGRKLVGEPSWILGKDAVIDGRIAFARRYTVVVKTNDLADYVLEDWTGFKRDSVIDKVYAQVSKYVLDMQRKIATENIEDTRQKLKQDFSKDVQGLSVKGRYEVNEAIEVITYEHPTAKPESISLAIETVIKLEKTRSGKELIQKLSQLNDDDIDGLNCLLSQWTVKDALSVLDEIERRISIIEAIKKLSSDSQVDELKVLHPLVTESRWLFGPEFDSPEYTSNKQLQTAVKKIFKISPDAKVFENHKKRPDIVVLPNSTVSATSIDKFDSETQLLALERILLIELKRGGSKISRDERNQAIGYIEDFVGCGSIVGNPYVHAFVVGDEFSGKVQPTQRVENENKVTVGTAQITTFGQLVDTAERRLFNLRKKLNKRYDDLPGMELYQRTIQLDLQTEPDK